MNELFFALTKHLYLNNKSKLEQFREREEREPELGMTGIEPRGPSMALKKDRKGKLDKGKKKKEGCC